MITVGADIEVFVALNLRGGETEYVPASLVVGDLHSKLKPLEFRNHGFHYDAEALECTIPEFKFDKEQPLQLYQAVKIGLLTTETLLKYKNPKLQSALLDYIVLPHYREISKGTEFNRYTGRQHPVESLNNLSTAGFHIHISGIPEAQIKRVITQLDMKLGIYYKTKKCTSRRVLYGALGSYKPKNYDAGIAGFEYRVLGASMLEEKHLLIISERLNQVLSKWV